MNLRQKILTWIGYLIFAAFMLGMIYTDTTTITSSDGHIMQVDQ